MGRKHRQDFDYAFHHVMNRAGARRLIFAAAAHRNVFFEVLQHVVATDEIQVHAYCLMSNHYHLLVRTPKQNLSAAMQRLSSMFTRSFNRIKHIDGSLFRGRFKSIIVGHDDYLRQLFRYIHRNPVAAGMVKTPQEYKWSSYRSYKARAQKPEWLTIDELPNYFSGADWQTFVEGEHQTKIDALSIEALFKPQRQKEPKSSLMPNQCLNRPLVERSHYLVLASLEDVINEVMVHYQIGREALLSCRRSVKNMPRDVCMFLAREEAYMRILDIANAFEIRKAAASSAVSRVKHQMELDAQFNQSIANITSRIRSCRLKAPAWTLDR